MNVKNLISAITAMVVTISLFTGITFASSLEKIHFIKIAPQDEKAVINGPDGKLRIIKPGDAVAETAKVVSIAAGRIVLEDKTDKGVETVIVRIENGAQRIERIRTQPDSAPLPVAPAQSQKQ